MKHYQNVSQLYDVTYAGRYQDTEFYKEILVKCIENKNDNHVLEIGAGTGRVLLPIAYELNNVNFVALDLIDDELEVLQNKAFQQNILNITTKCTDFLAYNPVKSFNAITAPFRVMQHCLSCEELENFSSTAFRLLQENGKFIFDLFNPSIEMLSKTGTVFEAEYKDKDTIINRSVQINERDYFKQTQKIEEYFNVTYEDNTKDTFDWIYETRYFFKDEVRLVLEKCGFEIEAVYGDFDKNTFGTGTYPGELVFVCNKPKANYTL